VAIDTSTLRLKQVPLRLPAQMRAFGVVLLALVLAGCASGAAVTPTPPVAPPAPVATATAIAAAVLATAALPNPKLTPGEVFPGVAAAQVCTSGYSGSVRNVLREQYVAVYAEYGLAYPQPPGAYELDHLIPLELGGDNANANLWPEPAAPAPGFHQKDELENLLHSRVCSGQLPLADAQRTIASDWLALYRQYLQP